MYRSFVTLVRFIPKYFILFDMMVHGIPKFLSLLSLSAYRNARNFYALILYPAISPNFLMSFNTFLVVFSEFSIYSMSSAK